MRATDFMTSPVVAFTSDMPIVEAVEHLLERGFSAVPVVDSDRRLIGIVSASDLLRGRTGADPTAHLRPPAPNTSPPPHTVGDVMTDKVFALPATADERDFAAAMIEHRYKSIPVVSGELLEGIVSASDLLRVSIRADDAILVDVTARLREYAGGQELCQVSVSEGVVTLSGLVSEADRRVATLLAETVPGAARVRVLNEVTAEAAPEQPAPSGVSPSDRRGLRVLALDECLELLRRNQVGRFAFIHQGTPVVLPVNYGVDHLDVVFRTTWGSKLRAAERSAVASFEIDGMDPDRKTGWSVLVKGVASPVYEESETARLDGLGVDAWAGLTDDAFWVRIRTDEITGREISAATQS